ncbi:MAG: hypothetical protein IID28_03295 [Planctomycetes bacterium]|nr:hypothetical protein [Planctomycetota bacterium]
MNDDQSDHGASFHDVKQIGLIAAIGIVSALGIRQYGRWILTLHKTD